MNKKIIVTANGFDMVLPPGRNTAYNLMLFSKLIYYGYSSITIDGVESTPDQVKAILKSEKI